MGLGKATAYLSGWGMVSSGNPSGISLGRELPGQPWKRDGRGSCEFMLLCWSLQRSSFASQMIVCCVEKARSGPFCSGWKIQMGGCPCYRLVAARDIVRVRVGVVVLGA